MSLADNELKYSNPEYKFETPSNIDHQSSQLILVYKQPKVNDKHITKELKDQVYDSIRHLCETHSDHELFGFIKYKVTRKNPEIIAELLKKYGGKRIMDIVINDSRDGGTFKTYGNSVASTEYKGKYKHIKVYLK